MCSNAVTKIIAQAKGKMTNKVVCKDRSMINSKTMITIKPAAEYFRILFKYVL